MRPQAGLVMTVLMVAAGCAGSRGEAVLVSAVPTTSIVVPAPTTTMPPIPVATTTLLTTTTALPATTTTAATSTTTSTSTTTTTSTTSTTTTTTSTSTTSTTSTTQPPAPSPTVASAPPPRTGSVWEVRPKSDIPPPPLPAGWETQLIGTSVLGREIIALHRPVEAPARVRVVVIGGIHGNEPVSPPIVRSLVDVPMPADIEVWLVPEMNPDGVEAGTRANANGVDLNRNFGWGWLPSDGGPVPFSEPEATAVADLIIRSEPHVAVWVHQPLDYISSVGSTPDSFEQAWATGAGLPVRPDVTQHGGGESWTHFTAGYNSMLIEANGWEATPEMVAAHRNGFASMIGLFG